MAARVTSRRWYLLVYGVIVLAIAVAAGWLALEQTREAERVAYTTVRTVAELKVRQIHRWRLDRMDDAAYFMHNPVVIDIVTNWLADPALPAAERLRQSLRTAQTYLGDENILLIAPDGQLLFSVEPYTEALYPALREAWVGACATNQVSFVDLHTNLVHAKPHIDVLAPLRVPGRDDGACAALVLQIDPEKFLYPLIQQWPVPSDSAETLLVRREGEQVRLLNRLRHSDAPPLSVILPLSATTVLSMQAALGRTGIFNGIDYRGEPVLAYITPIPDSPWVMVAKIDRAEVFAGLRQRLAFTAGASLLLLGLIGVSAAYLYQQERGHYLEEMAATQSELAASRQELDAFFTHNPTLLCIADTDGYFRRVNPAWQQVLGYAPEEMADRLINTFVHPDDQSPTQAQLEALARQEPVINFRNRYRHADGSYRVLQWYSFAVDKTVYAGATDVTAQHEMELALRYSEERLRLATELSGIMAGTCDRDLRYTWVHNSHLIGIAPQQLLGKRDDEILDARTAHTIMALRQQVMETGESLRRELEVELAGKRYVFDVLFAPLRNPAGEVVGMTTVARDITQHKEMEETLRRQTEQLTQVLATVPEGVAFLDAEGRVVLANPQALTDLAHFGAGRVGDTLRELGGLPLDQLTAQTTADPWREISAGGRTLEIAARPLQVNQHEHADAKDGWVVVLHDVTQTRATQRYVQQQERLATVGQLAAGIAHDFNNILAVITLYSELVLQSPRLGDKEHERLQTILQQSKHAAELVQQILDFSRQSVLQRTYVDLDEFLAGQAKLLRRTLPEHISVEYVCAPDPRGYIVHTDRTRLSQMILNLATNARDAMPTGGTLQIGLARLTLAPGESPGVPELKPGDWIEISVRDDGTGIAPEHLPHLFNPFFTTKAPGRGTGLGLAQVHGIVYQHGGSIGVESALGLGTTFRIYLPAAANEPPPATCDVAPATVYGAGETILVVEDDDTVRAALAETLYHWQYRVLEASNGAEALVLLAAEAQRIRLILSDVVMPVMGGLELVDELRARGSTVPVVLLTGHPLQHLTTVQPNGVFACLLKPPPPDVLLRTLTSALGRIEPSDDAPSDDAAVQPKHPR